MSRLVVAVLGGQSQVLVLRGEAGIGKTALLEFLVEHASGCRVTRAAGVESEMELPYAGLQQLCGPYMDRVDGLPEPQRKALGTAFELRAGSPPDRFGLGLAVLTLLSEVAEEKPLICLVDDAHWLDQASTQALEFVARRLHAESLAIVFAVRDNGGEPRLTGLPELTVRRLPVDEAAGLLESAVPWPLDPQVRDRILGEAQGNPLALLELPRGLTATELTVGVAGAERTTALISRLERGFERQLTPLPPQSRQLLLAAAAEPVGDVTVLWRAAEQLGLGADAAGPAEAAGLIEFGDRVRFRHPLVRSVVYRSATPPERRQVHYVLADVISPDRDPDRRAWHRARAVVGTDETIAAELDRAAERALASGGFAAAAAFLEMAAVLTPESPRRAQRSLDAAEAKATLGAFEEASSLLSAAQAGSLDDAGQARIELLRARIVYNSGRRHEALPLFVAAARRFEPLDTTAAREIYLDALSAAVFSGKLGSAAEPGMRQVAAAVRRSPALQTHGKADMLLEGLATLYTDGYSGAVPMLRRAVAAFSTDELTLDEGFRGAWVAVVAAVDLWDDVHWDVMTRRHLDVVRASGALSVLPLALATRAVFHIRSGDLASAASLVAEGQWVAEVTVGENSGPAIPDAWLAATRGDESTAAPLIQAIVDDAVPQGEGTNADMMWAASAVLYNGLGRYQEALDAARKAAREAIGPGAPKWALAELVEAGVRAGHIDAAAEAFQRLSAMTRASGTDWARGIEAAAGALLRDDSRGEDLYQEAIQRLGSTRMRLDLARAQLRYGEWLRRQGRRVDARGQLRPAHEAFTAMGAAAFAERARHELLATGETVRRRSVESRGDLTAQEAHIARLVMEGLTNPEIAAQLYLSPRTVEWHLRKVFTKLGVTTRVQLRRTLNKA